MGDHNKRSAIRPIHHSLPTAGNGLEERIYVLHDANYSVTALVNTSGNVIERYYYEAYGRSVYLDASFDLLPSAQSQHVWQHLHQGGRLDSATGNYHFRHRDLSPTLGRWISQDPIGFEAGDANLYRYVGNGSTGLLDPIGLSPIPPSGDQGNGDSGNSSTELEWKKWLQLLGKAKLKEIRQEREVQDFETEIRDGIIDFLPDRLIPRDIRGNPCHPPGSGSRNQPKDPAWLKDLRDILRPFRDRLEPLMPDDIRGKFQPFDWKKTPFEGHYELELEWKFPRKKI